MKAAYVLKYLRVSKVHFKALMYSSVKSTTYNYR